MREYLRRCRTYLYTGTTPASYTLGLIEAMLSGVPVVSLSGKAWTGPSDLFEGDEIAKGWDTPAEAAQMLRRYLEDPVLAASLGWNGRRHAEQLFGIDKITEQWIEFLR
jgi:glycosyltransferase involved in cell wall biosynthesis